MMAAATAVACLVPLGLAPPLASGLAVATLVVLTAALLWGVRPGQRPARMPDAAPWPGSRGARAV
jgi:hypothetical protein